MTFYSSPGRDREDLTDAETTWNASLLFVYGHNPPAYDDPPGVSHVSYGLEPDPIAYYDPKGSVPTEPGSPYPPAELS